MCSGLALQVEEPSQVENYGEIGNFRCLNPDGPKANPAMCGVGIVEEKSADEHEDDEAERAVNDDRFAQLAVVHAHEREHSGDAENQPDGLAQKKIIGMTIIVFGGDGRGAVNHHSAEQAEAKRHSKMPTVAFSASWHWSPLSRHRCGSMVRKLMHKLLENAATMFVVFELVEAGAGGREQNDVAGLR